MLSIRASSLISLVRPAACRSHSSRPIFQAWRRLCTKIARFHLFSPSTLHRVRLPAPSTRPRASAATTMAPPSPPPKPSSTLLSVSLSGDTLVTSTGATILSGLPSSGIVSARPAIDGAGLILAAASPGGPTAQLDLSLGQLHGRRFLALSRICLWWIAPVWGTIGVDAIPPETQFLLLQVEQDSTAEGSNTMLHEPTYAVMLPLIDSRTFRGTLRPGDKKNAATLNLRMESGAGDVLGYFFNDAVFVAAGNDPYELIGRGVAAAAALSGTARPRSEKPAPPTADAFLWCTWDAFYSKVSAAGVREGLAAFAAGGVSPIGVIIDDGWQVTDVDPQYRPGRAKKGGSKAGSDKLAAAPLGAASENGTATANGNGNTIDAEVEMSTLEVRNAAAELLAGAGDQGAEALKGELKMQVEAKATAGAPRRRSLLGSLRLGVTRAVSRVEAALLHTAHAVIEATPVDSVFLRGFGTLAAGALRPALLRFYAAATDHTRRLCTIQANAKFAGPSATADAPLSATGGDLAAVVSSLKTDFGLRYVYMWHAMGGFWGGLGMSDPGVAPYSPRLLMPTPTPGVLEVDPAVAWVQPVLSGVSLPASPTALHADLHAYLAACGVDGVKVDVQGTIGLVGSAPGVGGGPALAAAFHESLEASAAAHFSFSNDAQSSSEKGVHLINCMCHSTEDLYNFSDSNLARVSDDFYPRRPASHTAHIAACAYNTLFIGEIAVPDWDMFHSQHEAAAQHAAARALSGGPVYVSDAPGRHDFELLRRLVLRDGSTLRARLPGRPTADCLFSDVSRDGVTALKLWTANAVTAAVGVFNVQGSAFDRRRRAFTTHDASPGALTAVVRPRDAPTLAAALVRAAGGTGMCVMYSDAKKEMTIVDAAEGEEGGLEVTVAGGGGHDVIALSAVLSAPGAESGGVLFAPVGLVNMLNAGGAVMGCELAAAGGSGGGVAARLALRGEGEFLAYASHRPVGVDVAGAIVEFEYDASASALRFSLVAAAPEAAGARQDCVVRF